MSDIQPTDSDRVIAHKLFVAIMGRGDSIEAIAEMVASFLADSVKAERERLRAQFKDKAHGSFKPSVIVDYSDVVAILSDDQGDHRG